MNVLTKLQYETLIYMRDYEREHGYPPFVREVAEHFGVTHTTIRDRLYTLEARGYVTRLPLRHRSFRVKRLPGMPARIA